MAKDPQYREKQFQIARAATRRWRDRKRKNPIAIAKRRAKDRARYVANRQAILAKRRAEYAGTAGARIRSTNREWQIRNRDVPSAQRKLVRKNNGELVRAKERESHRRLYALDPRKRLDYCGLGAKRTWTGARGYVRISNQRRRSDAGSFTLDEWMALVAANNGQCAYCGSREKIEADHRVPLVRGGLNTIDNIVPACRQCNRRKHHKTEEEFRDLLQQERIKAVLSEWRSLPGGEAAAR